MGDTWKLKPDREVMDYLEGKSAGNPISSGNNRWTPKPDKGIMSYLEEGGNVETLRAEPRPGVDVRSYLEAFNDWNERKERLWNGGLDLEKAYGLVGKCGSLPKTESEIQELLYAIPEKDANHAGVFISYVVNEVYPHKEIELRVERPFGKLGTLNREKKWRLIGDVGEDIGCAMTGGEIIIEGNAGDCIGICMKGGKITVNGNAGGGVGAGRYGGEIHLHGTYETISPEKEGRIYHNGRPMGGEGVS